MGELTYIVDIDGTICNVTDGDYGKCTPFIDRIKKLNSLHDEGNVIIYATARGMGSSGGDQIKAFEKYYQYTLEQLEEWGCKFDKLYLGKPKGDFYVDDKCIRDIDFFKEK